MGKWNMAVLTNAGKELVAKSVAGKCVLELVSVRIGSGMYTAEESTKDSLSVRTSLKNPKNEFGISSFAWSGDTLLVKSVLDNHEVEEAFYIRELGLYARERGSGKEPQLISIVLSAAPDYFPDKMSPYTIVQHCQVMVDCDDEMIGLAENMGAFALADDLNALDREVREVEKTLNSHAGNNTLHSDTKNTAGATDTSDKLYLVGSPDQSANPQTYSQDTAYIGTDGCLYSDGKIVATKEQLDSLVDAIYQQATAYADQIKSDIYGGTPSATLDTIAEIAKALEDNDDVVSVITEELSKKAAQAELDTHTGNDTIHITETERTKWDDANNKKHSHSNKSILEKITQALLDKWNSAYDHISDAVKHITSSERTLWDTVVSKSDLLSSKFFAADDGSAHIYKIIDIKVNGCHASDCLSFILLSRNSNAFNRFDIVYKLGGDGSIYDFNIFYYQSNDNDIQVYVVSGSDGYHIEIYATVYSWDAVYIYMDKILNLSQSEISYPLTRDASYPSTYALHAEATQRISHTHDDRYLPLAGGTVIGLSSFTDGLKVSGRISNSGDDEGLLIERAPNGFAGIILGTPTGIRSVFYLNNGDKALWRYNDGKTSHDILHPAKSGTIALTSDIPTALPANGGTSKYADSAGTNIVCRVEKNSQSLPGVNRFRVEEYVPGADYDLPTNDWYHIYTTEGQDANYATQLALGMRSSGAYYRRYTNKKWSIWHSLINTDTTNFLPLSGGVMSGDIDFQGAANNHHRTFLRGKNADDWFWSICAGDDGFDISTKSTESDGTCKPIKIMQYLNAYVKRIFTLLDENGNTEFPGIVKAPLFQGGAGIANKYIASPFFSGTEKVIEVGAIKISGCAGAIIPGCRNSSDQFIEANGFMTIGTPTYKFSTIYSSKSTLNGSDRFIKEQIKSMTADEDEKCDQYMELFDNIDICTFKYRDLNRKEDSLNPFLYEPNRRRHTGVIGQALQDDIVNAGLDEYDFAAVCTDFFAPPERKRAAIFGGYQAPKVVDGTEYSYSDNTYNWKHAGDSTASEDYVWFNEILDKDIADIEIDDWRTDIQYLMIEDNSKLTKNQPPVIINSITLVDMDDNYVDVPLDLGCVANYEWDDSNYENPRSSCELLENGSLKVNFQMMYGNIFLKIAEESIDITKYKRILFDIDYISEYKMILIPKGNYTTANIWDRVRQDKILYNYSVRYQELHNLTTYALQKTRREFAAYREETDRKMEEQADQIRELLDMVSQLMEKE